MQPVELWIGMRRGIASAGETTEAEVRVTFKLGDGDENLETLVETGFHRVRRSLMQALESEVPAERNEVPRIEEVEDLTDWAPAAPAKSPIEEVAALDETAPPMKENDEVESRMIADSTEAETITITDASATLVRGQTVNENDFERPAGSIAKQDVTASEEPSIGTTVREEERLPITPAQKRTVLSLCNTAGIDGRQLQVMLESGYNRTSLDSMGRREAGSLIFRLSQRQRENMLRDKTDFVPDISQNTRHEEVSPNGTH